MLPTHFSWRQCECVRMLHSDECRVQDYLPGLQYGEGNSLFDRQAELNVSTYFFCNRYIKLQNTVILALGEEILITKMYYFSLYFTG